MNMKNVCAIIAAAAGLAVGTSANADVLLSFGYTDLSGSFDGSAFHAVAVDNAAFSTSGDVTRLDSVGGTAAFAAGLAFGPTAASVEITIDVTSLGGQLASGAGGFVLTDIDGDTIQGDISGTWTSAGIGGIAFFAGMLNNVTLTSNVNGTFDGTSGGAVDMELPGAGPYEGAFVQLFINSGGGFFDAPFDGISVQVNGEVIPTPGSLAILSLAGLAAVRRRR